MARGPGITIQNESSLICSIGRGSVGINCQGESDFIVHVIVAAVSRSVPSSLMQLTKIQVFRKLESAQKHVDIIVDHR